MNPSPTTVAPEQRHQTGVDRHDALVPAHRAAFAVATVACGVAGVAHLVKEGRLGVIR